MISLIELRKNKTITERDLSHTLGPQNFRKGLRPNVSLAAGNFGLAKRSNSRRRRGTSLAAAKMGLNKG